MNRKEMTNEVLCERIESLRELVKFQFADNKLEHKQVNNHLLRLNGEVAKNSKFRSQALAYVPLVAILISILIQKITDRL